MLIYKVTNRLNNKVYVGQTINSLGARKRSHESAWSYKRCTYFDKMLNEEGKENFNWEIIEDNIPDKVTLSEREVYWIDKLNSLYINGRGYNFTTGGESGWTHNDDTISYLKEINSGENNPMYGRRSDNGRSKRVLCTTTNKIYDNATIAAEDENCNPFKVYCVCRGERETTGGKVFRYIDEHDKIIHDAFKENIFYNNTLGKKYYSIREIRTTHPELNHIRTLSSKLKEIKDHKNEFVIWSKEVWSFNPDLHIDVKRLVGSHGNTSGKIILNETTDKIYFSMREASVAIGRKPENGRNLATAIRKGNGSCIWNKYSWRLI